jgi:hypothetical protein
VAATIRKNCGACGKYHTLILQTVDLPNPQTKYEFTCPGSGKAVALEANDSRWWQVVKNRPADAVDVREV